MCRRQSQAAPRGRSRDGWRAREGKRTSQPSAAGGFLPRPPLLSPDGDRWPGGTRCRVPESPDPPPQAHSSPERYENEAEPGKAPARPPSVTPFQAQKRHTNTNAPRREHPPPTSTARVVCTPRACTRTPARPRRRGGSPPLAGGGGGSQAGQRRVVPRPFSARRRVWLAPSRRCRQARPAARPALTRARFTARSSVGWPGRPRERTPSFARPSARVAGARHPLPAGGHRWGYRGRRRNPNGRGQRWARGGGGDADHGG